MKIAETIVRNGTVTNNAARKRQATYRQRMAEAGLVQVTGWVHHDQMNDAVQLLRRLRNNKALIPGPLRNRDTNKFVSLNGTDNEAEE